MNQFSTEQVTIFRVECNKATLDRIFELIRSSDNFRHISSEPKAENLRIVQDQFRLTLHVVGTKEVQSMTELLLECGSVAVESFVVLVVPNYNETRGDSPYITQAPLERRLNVRVETIVQVYLIPLGHTDPKEKVWVRVTKREVGEGSHRGYVCYSGILESTPFSEHLPAKGSVIEFTHSSILEISPCP